MGFWTESIGADPKRQYRFIAEFAGLGGECSWMVKNIDKPSVSLSEASHEYLNHTFYYPGRVTWNSVSVTLVDPVEPDATATMMNAMFDAGYKIPKGYTSEDDLSTVSKSSATSVLGEVKIRQINSDGKDVEVWKLRNAWIKSVTLSGLDYSGDSLSEVTMELRYDFASLTTHGDTVNGKLSANTGLWDLSG
jgi:hypothetical protein|tara:strand:- start:1441 stop:2016 length:576 start_codon:yes stop_codon:yes gene_type:complete